MEFPQQQSARGNTVPSFPDAKRESPSPKSASSVGRMTMCYDSTGHNATKDCAGTTGCDNCSTLGIKFAHGWTPKKTAEVVARWLSDSREPTLAGLPAMQPNPRLETAEGWTAHQRLVSTLAFDCDWQRYDRLWRFTKRLIEVLK